MTFKQANAELAKLADGKYNTLSFTLTTHSDGTQETKCMVYVNGLDWYAGKTWRDALSLLRGVLEVCPSDIEEVPDITDNEVNHE